MAERRLRFIDSSLANYLKTEIENGSLVRRKQALQQLCKFSWQGLSLRQRDRIGMELTVLGVLSSSYSDEKVRRWALVVLGYIGRKEVSTKAVMQALNDYPDEPQVIAAAIATLFRYDSASAQNLISHRGCCTPEMATLAALQTTDPKQLNLSNVRIDINKAEPISLKLALLLVGLDKAPDNIFDPKYPNATIVKILGTHDEPVVSQYSVWAAAQNPRLGTEDIGIKLTKIDDQPANVRSYVYQIFASDKRTSIKRHDIIFQGSVDPSEEARLGLAVGLRDSYYDGLEEIVLQWFKDEDDDDIRFYILDHIVAQANKLGTYKEIALQEYRAMMFDGQKRMRLEAAAAGKETFTEFRKMYVMEEAGGLFGVQGGSVTNNYLTINGPVQGALSQSGIASNNSQSQTSLTITQREEILKLLDKVTEDIVSIAIPDDLKSEVCDTIEQTKKNTDKSNINKVINVLEKISNGFKSIDSMIDFLLKVKGYAATLAQYIQS